MKSVGYVEQHLRQTLGMYVYAVCIYIREQTICACINFVYVCVCVSMYVCTYVCTYVRVYVRTYVRTYACMYMCMCMY